MDNHSCDRAWLPDNIFVPWCLYIMLDLHLPEMRQLFKDACCFQHSEFIVVQAPSNRRKDDQGIREWHRSQCKRIRPTQVWLTVLLCTEGCDQVFWWVSGLSSRLWCLRSDTSPGKPSPRSSPRLAYSGNPRYLVAITDQTSPNVLISQESKAHRSPEPDPTGWVVGINS